MIFGISISMGSISTASAPGLHEEVAGAVAVVHVLRAAKPSPARRRRDALEFVRGAS